MLVRNKVQDYTTWRKIFDQNADSFPHSALTLEWIRQDADDPQQVWFSLLVEDRAKAEEYLADPIHAKIGQQAGVIDGEIFYIQDTD